jgi:hypothetical protein
MADSSRATTRDDDDDAPSSRRASAAKSSIDDAAWDEAVNEWLDSYMRNSVMSSASPEAYSHMVASLPELRKILSKKL